VSCDIETTGLYPWDEGAAIVTLGFGTAAGEFSLFINHSDSPWSKTDVKKIIDRINKKLDDCILVFQNGKFDCLWLLVHYGVKWSNDFDTMLAHYLTDENSPHDLEFLAQLFFGAPKWDIPLEEKQGKASMEKIASYHAHDLFYTRRLYFKLKKALSKDPQVEKVFNKLLMPVARLFVEMECHGCFIDHTKHVEAEKFLNNEIRVTTKNLSKWGDINWASPKQVGELLYGKLKLKCPMKTKKGANSTAESALKQIDHDCVADLLRFRGAKQQLSFFVDGWKPYIVDHRIHPSFKLHGTVTGRPSCEHPNFQQVPRDTRIRSQITAPPGYVLLEADLSQIELRLIAEISRDPSMMKAFREGVDIHWLTAMRELERGAGQAELVIETAKTLSQRRGPMKYGEAIEILLEAGPDAAQEVDKVWKELRKKAKAVNFGYSYGMWWKKFIIYARDNYDMKISPEEAQESRKSFFDLYRLEDWHSDQRRYARRHGFVRSLFGRKRRLPQALSYEDTPERAEALRQAINSPIQSCASDLNLAVLLQMSSEFSRLVFQPTVTVHDSILIEVRIDAVDRVVRRIEEIMTGPDILKDFGIEFTVPICGDTKLGPWGSGVSYEKWKRERQHV
jgi:DNA polymerase-1